MIKDQGLLKKITIDGNMMDDEQEICKDSLKEEQRRESLLKRLDVYIETQVRQTMGRQSWLICQEVKDLEIDEVTQRVRIRFWHMLQRDYIRYPLAYIKTIIYSEIIDMYRRQKITLALPTGENEEYHETLMVSDPADEVIQRLSVTSLLNKVVPLVLKLPPRQKLAMICQLRDQVDDLVQLIDTFKKYRVDIETLQWPTEKTEKQLLRASLSAARRNLARDMSDGQDMGMFRARDAQTSQSSQSIVEKEHQAMERKDTKNRLSKVLDEEGKDAVTIAEIEAHIEKLQDPYRRAVVLHYLERLNYYEIAAQLHLPVGTVKSHVSRGMKMLREYSKQQDIENQHTINAKRYPASVEEMAELVASLDKLQEPYRRAVTLRHIEQRSYPEIAAQLDLPVGTVKSHVSRGMKMLFGS